MYTPSCNRLFGGFVLFFWIALYISETPSAAQYMIYSYLQLYWPYLNDFLRTFPLFQFGHHVILPLARQKYWEISLRVVDPKIPALCDFKASKDYKKSRQVRDPSKSFL
jgi:hypothetical protein